MSQQMTVEMVGLDGESFRLPEVSVACSGQELRDLARSYLLSSKRPRKSGRIVLQVGSKMLDLKKTLKEQGLLDSSSSVRVSYVYVPANLENAWRFVESLPVDDEVSALDGITHLEGISSLKQVRQLPESLECLAFGGDFNETLEGLLLPNGIQSLKFGNLFNQTFQRVRCPSSLLTLTFGDSFNQTLEGLSWPSCLQKLTLGKDFNQDLKGVLWPTRLENLTFGEQFNQPVDEVIWPDFLQRLVFGRHFNQQIGFKWPPNLHTLTLGEDFNQSLDEISWSSSHLLNIRFGDEFNQSLDRVQWPKNLNSLSFGHRFNRHLLRVSWPHFLQTLHVGDANVSLKHLPAGIRSLSLGDKFNQRFLALICFPFFGDFSYVKHFLTHLAERHSWDFLLFSFPGYFERKLLGLEGNPFFAYHQLCSLNLGDSFNKSLEGVTAWPDSLQSLRLGRKFNQSFLVFQQNHVFWFGVYYFFFKRICLFNYSFVYSFVHLFIFQWLCSLVNMTTGHMIII